MELTFRAAEGKELLLPLCDISIISDAQYPIAATRASISS